MKKESTAVNDFFNRVVKKSWTWQRLTDEEKSRFNSMDNIFDKIKGNDSTRIEWFNTVYEAFLVALGYEPIGWRETEEVPKF